MEQTSEALVERLEVERNRHLVLLREALDFLESCGVDSGLGDGSLGARIRALFDEE